MSSSVRSSRSDQPPVVAPSHQLSVPSPVRSRHSVARSGARRRARFATRSDRPAPPRTDDTMIDRVELRLAGGRAAAMRGPKTAGSHDREIARLETPSAAASATCSSARTTTRGSSAASVAACDTPPASRRSTSARSARAGSTAIKPSTPAAVASSAPPYSATRTVNVWNEGAGPSAAPTRARRQSRSRSLRPPRRRSSAHLRSSHGGPPLSL